jgi:DDE superfamily endonuclease
MTSSDSESDNEDAPIVPLAVAGVGVGVAVAVANERVRKRHYYPFSVKEKILMVQEAYGTPNNVSKTARKYSVYCSGLVDWNSNLLLLKAKALINPHAKTTHAGREVHDIDVDPVIKDWILAQRTQNIAVHTRNIIQFAIQTKPPFKGGDVKKQVKWVYRFLGRNGLSIRRPTRIGQKLSGHLQEVQDDMTRGVRERLAVGGSLHGLDPKYFINMDQTAVWFEMKSSTTVDVLGAQTVSVRDSGSNSKRCTVCLAVAADGTKLPPFVVFKGKLQHCSIIFSINKLLTLILSIIGVPGAIIERNLNTLGWLACVQEKGWFDIRVGKIWIEKVLKPYVADAEQSYLLVDHFAVHTSAAFVKAANDLGTEVDFIPAGYTCVLQPVDVGVNSQFKHYIRDCHQTWCMTEYPRYNPEVQKFPTPERDDIYQWILSAFELVTPLTIVRTFAHIGYTVLNQLQAEEVENLDNDPLIVADHEEEVFVDPAELDFELTAIQEALLDVVTQMDV